MIIVFGKILVLRDKGKRFQQRIDKMKNYLYGLFIIIIVVTALGFAPESKSFDPDGGGEGRYIRKITIVNPLGGEEFLSGSKQKISWQISRTIRYVKIEYSIDNGKNWIEIVKSMKIDEPFGSYDWKVPCTPTSEARIRISDVYGPDYDVIINSFTILCDSSSDKVN